MTVGRAVAARIGATSWKVIRDGQLPPSPALRRNRFSPVPDMAGPLAHDIHRGTGHKSFLHLSNPSQYYADNVHYVK